jgi:hypothetical protein
MKTMLIFIAIIAPFVLANYYRPTLDQHKTKIYAQAAGEATAVDEELLARPEWNGLEFNDWALVTATQDKQKQTMVSYGIGTYIKVVDPKWAPKAFGLQSSEIEEQK